MTATATADGRRRSLRWWLLAVMAAVALLPALAVAAVGYGSLQRLAELAAAQSHRAVEREVRAQLESRAEQLARANDFLFRQVQAQAASLARYAGWLYEHPQYLGAYLGGNTPLTRNRESGHLVNDPKSAVGVFVSRQAQIRPALWDEVGRLSYVDPVLLALQQDNPHSARIWVISATGIVRIYPNPGLGHPGSPVGPDYDLTQDEPFRALAPERNPSRRSRWTAPYWDPAGSGWLITAGVPIYVGGEFRGVAGVDMSLAAIREQVLEVSLGPGSYAFLVDGEGRLVSAPPAAYADFQLRLQTPAPGQGAGVTLADSPLPDVRRIGGLLAAGELPPLGGFTGAGGPRYLAAAPLPATGWTLALVLPEAAVTGAAAAVQAEISATARRLLVSWTAALAAVLVLVAWISGRVAAGLLAPLRRLVEGTRRLAEDLSYRLPPLRRDELGDLAEAFNAMGDKLEASRAAALASARLAGEERERAARASDLAVAEERNRLAREIHDTLAQGLAGIVLQLEAAEDSLPPGSGTAAAHLDRARALARESLQEARRSVWNLRPRRLEEAGLAGALAALAEETTGDGVRVDARLEPAPPLAPAAAEALYRVAQEAVANVRRHSGARRASLELAAAPGPGGRPGARLTVTDDGHGFDPAARTGPTPAGGFGLWAMAERAAALGGQLEIVSEPGRGTRVRLWLPAAGGDSDGAGD